ncbi:HtaA domain-containing protein [Streptomyces sp. NPDC002537]
MTVTARRAALAALATATALGATALSAPAFAVEAPQTEGAQQLVVKSGTLKWGVKESFRSYVGKSGGEIKVDDGAKQAPKNGPFTFVKGEGSYDTAHHAASTTFKGSVRFLGHGGELDLKFSDLKVKIAEGGEKGSITADVTSGDETRDDVAIAAIDMKGVRATDKAGTMTFAKIPVKVTAEGAKVFSYKGSSFYKEGEQFDDATLALKTAPAEPKKDEGKETKDQGTQTDGDTSTKDQGTQTSGGAGGKDQGTGQTGGDATGGAQQPAPGKLVDGNLDWGLKESFRKYIDRTSGKAEVSDGAKSFKGGYRFPKGKGEYNAEKSSLDVKFEGAVRFTAHGGDLDLKFSAFHVNVASRTGKIIADVTSNGKLTSNVELATFEVTDSLKPKDSVVALSAAPAKLTEAGTKAFVYKQDSFYKAGDSLDPVTVAVATDDKAKLPDVPSDAGSETGTTGGTTSTTTTATNTAASTGGSTTGGSTTGGTATDTTASGSLASTGADVPTGPILGGAAALVVAGGAAVYATRRRRTATAQN